MIKREDSVTQSLENSPSPTQYREMNNICEMGNFANTNDDALSGIFDPKDDLSNFFPTADSCIETQMSITERSGNMTLSECNEETNGNLLVMSDDEIQESVPRKARKHSFTESPSSYSSPTATTISDDFDLNTSPVSFTFQTFGSTVLGASKFINCPTQVKDSISGPQYVHLRLISIDIQF